MSATTLIGRIIFSLFSAVLVVLTFIGKDEIAPYFGITSLLSSSQLISTLVIAGGLTIESFLKAYL